MESVPQHYMHEWTMPERTSDLLGSWMRRGGNKSQKRWLELRDEWRLENRKAFANILSDFVFGVSLFILLCFNDSKVKLLKFTGYKILNNISDAGKAFLIILISDILLGYHSEYGWTTAVEMLVEHYGIEVDRSAITIFVCIVPVVTDTFVKLWKTIYITGRKTDLVNSVSNSMRTYIMSLFPLSANIEHRFDEIRRSFLWHGNKEKSSFNLVKWKTMLLNIRIWGTRG
ncbi:hypothetical protein H5410_037473 [Solanum commersonii]|uniref:Chloroplast envelope membrane protein n=1 Tax=Solanum commersonii TaxID=4109 RepID=A0A9J5Y790_SOLCO|nr:hypothetical protein H5410_037473 [Solanum commersonii]